MAHFTSYNVCWLYRALMRSQITNSLSPPLSMACYLYRRTAAILLKGLSPAQSNQAVLIASHLSSLGPTKRTDWTIRRFPNSRGSTHRAVWRGHYEQSQSSSRASGQSASPQGRSGWIPWTFCYEEKRKWHGSEAWPAPAQPTPSQGGAESPG